MMKYHSEFDCYGFDRAALLKFLSSEGVHLQDEVSSKPEPTAVKEVPGWAKLLKPIKRLTLHKAACVLIGTDPMNVGWLGNEWTRDYEKVFEALNQAAEDGELLAVGEDEFDHDVFRVQDLRAWAISVGLDWCIPFDERRNARLAEQVTVLDRGLQEAADATHRLRQLEADNARLVEQVAGLQRQLQEATAAAKQAPQEAGPSPQLSTAAPQHRK